MNFEKIAPFLKDPLILIGFFLFVASLFIRTLVTKGIIPVLKQTQGFSILKLILLYGFLIGLLIIGLGLKYRELSGSEQKNIVSLLVTEIDTNIQVISELKKNTESFLSHQIEISKALRTEGIKILPVMFPQINLDLDSAVNTSDLAQQAFINLAQTGLADNPQEVKQMERFSKALTNTLMTVRQTNENLRDKEGRRYQISYRIWESNLETYKGINIIDVTLFQKAYSQMNNIRNDYGIVASSTIAYSDNLTDYFKDDNELTWEQLATVLSVERHSYNLMVEYSKNLINTTTDLIAIRDKLKKAAGNV